MPSLDVAINALRAEAGAKKFDKSVKKIQKGAKDTDRAVKKNDETLNRFGGTLGKVAVGMVGMAAAYKGMRLAQTAVKEFAAFEQQLANVSTMLDRQTMGFLPQYRKELQGLSIQFGQTTETLSKGLYDILSASVGAADAMDVLRVSSKAAIGGLTTTAIAADAITTVMNSYGMEAKDAEKISDILFATVKGGKITFSELAGSIGKVVSIAASAGLSFEQVSAVIATMTRNGIKSDMAMTSLKAIITGFIKPTEEAVETAAKYNLILNAQTLQTIGLTGAMELLKDATSEETAAIFPNIRALLGVEATRKNVVAMIGDHEKALDHLGKSEEAYLKNANTLSVTLERNKAAWQALRIEVASLTKTPISQWLEGSILLTKDLSKALAVLQKGRLPGLFKKEFEEIERINKQFDPQTIRAFNDNLKEQEAIFQKISGIEMPEFIGPVSYEEQLRQISKYIESIGTFKPIKQDVELAGLDTPLTASQKKLRAKQAEAARRMFDDMDDRGEESYQNRLLLLRQEYNDYNQFVEDKKLLDAWYEEQKSELESQRALTDDDFQKGFSAKAGIMQQDMIKLGEIGAQTAETMQTSMAGAMKSMIMNGATLKEAMHGFAMSMLASFVDVITKMISMQIMASAFGVIAPAVGGGGGFVGPPSPFKNAKGNVFRAGVRAFKKGGLIGQPTIFPMANGGIGLAGEAGTEAIMPLGRDGQGRLGIHNSGSDEEKQPMKIINVVDESMMEEYLNTGSGERAIMNIINRNREGGSESFI